LLGRLRMSIEEPKKPPMKDPPTRKGPLRDPSPNEPPRRDPAPKGPDSEPKWIDDPKPDEDTPDEIKAS